MDFAKWFAFIIDLNLIEGHANWNYRSNYFRSLSQTEKVKNIPDMDLLDHS
jgi:hypothetical protein